MEAALKLATDDIGVYPIWVCPCRDRSGPLSVIGSPSAPLEGKDTSSRVYIVDIGNTVWDDDASTVLPLGLTPARLTTDAHGMAWWCVCRRVRSADVSQVPMA